MKKTMMGFMNENKEKVFTLVGALYNSGLKDEAKEVCKALHIKEYKIDGVNILN